MALLGTETEYGILAPDAVRDVGRPADPEWLSALVVDAYAGAATPALAEVHNRVLGNGARLYVDHGHPEYATPETTSPTAATVHELAGDLIVARAALAASELAGTRIRVFKNNTDGKGNSYGYHENYLLSRATPWALIEDALPTFLATRVVFAGAGRVGLGPFGETAGFQRSQRADFFERVSGLDTTRNRGLVNTRDEPHATPSRWRRLHVIPGDANRNPFATWLKLGVTSLVLAALELGRVPEVRLADPVAGFRLASRAADPRTPLRLAGGGAASAIEIQRRFLDAVGQFASDHPAAEARDVLEEWTGVLDDLERDPALTADRLDWPAKLALLERVRARDHLAWDAPRLAQLDLAWADLDDAASPYAILGRAGRLADWIDRRAVERATTEPPADTRAFTRGRLVADHPDAVIAATWDSVLLRDARGVLRNVRMSEPTAHTAADYNDDPSLSRPLGKLPPVS